MNRIVLESRTATGTLSLGARTLAASLPLAIVTASAGLLTGFAALGFDFAASDFDSADFSTA